MDVALKALSPGINDVTTAVMCVDYLTAILTRLASRGIPSSHRYEDGELRIIAVGPTFASLVAESFDQLRGSANGNVAIMLRMLKVLQTIGTRTASPGRRETLREQVQWIDELAGHTVSWSMTVRGSTRDYRACAKRSKPKPALCAGSEKAN